MTSGGKRPGAGRKPGIPNKTEKSAHLKRIRQQISLPKWIAEKLKSSESNISRYILNLILRDKKWEEEPESEIVAEARKRAEALTANPPYPGYQGSVRTELAFLLWQRAGMPLHPSEGGSNPAHEGFPLRTADIAEQVDMVPSRIRQQVRDFEKAGYAKKIGRDWFFSPEAVGFLKKGGAREIKCLRGTTPEGGKCR